MHRDVAAVVDVGAREAPPRLHGRQHLVGDGARDRRHRCDEARPVRPTGAAHPPRHRASQRRTALAEGASQQVELGDQIVEDRRKARAGLTVGGAHLGRLAEGLGHDVDRPVLQVQPAAVGQDRHAGSARHQKVRSGSGQGLAGGHGSALCSASPSACSSGTMRSTWPPSAANSARLSVNSMGATRAGVGT